jgi:hypothetical protein
MKKLDSVGTVIAVRNLDLRGGKEVVVTIGMPRKTPDEDDYYCPYQITGADRSDIRYAVGVDAVQALELALRMIGADLYTSNEALNGALSWEGGIDGDLGFPRP